MKKYGLLTPAAHPRMIEMAASPQVAG
jgi:hypothetical protein